MGLLDDRTDYNKMFLRAKKKTPREKGTNPRAMGTNPRAKKLLYDRKLAQEDNDRLRFIKSI